MGEYCSHLLLFQKCCRKGLNSRNAFHFCISAFVVLFHLRIWMCKMSKNFDIPKLFINFVTLKNLSKNYLLTEIRMRFHEKFSKTSFILNKVATNFICVNGLVQSFNCCELVFYSTTSSRDNIARNFIK